LNGVVALEANVHQLLQNILVHIRFAQGHRHFANVRLWDRFAAFTNPGMLTNLIQSCSLLRVHHQHATNQIATFGRYMIGNSVLAIDDLRKQLLEGIAIERKRTAHQHVKQHA